MERGIIFTFRNGTILLVDISLPSCTGKMTQHVIFCRLRVNITQHAAVTELRKKKHLAKHEFKSSLIHRFSRKKIVTLFSLCDILWHVLTPKEHFKIKSGRPKV